MSDKPVLHYSHILDKTPFVIFVFKYRSQGKTPARVSSPDVPLLVKDEPSERAIVTSVNENSLSKSSRALEKRCAAVNVQSDDEQSGDDGVDPVAMLAALENERQALRDAIAAETKKKNKAEIKKRKVYICVA
ncbi:hypothetical protein HWV62_34201 [Athelia sp. TMB]|nr:hypothetical protein HWV62_34201 [Athelia sp. TMB]